MRRLARYLIPLVSLFAIVGMLRALDAATTLSGLVTLPSPTMVMPGPIISGQALRLGESITTSFDPRVSGLTRPVGSIVYTRDGTASYIKTGSTSTAWEAIGSGSVGGSTTSQGQITARAGQLAGFGAQFECARDDYFYSPQTLNSVSNAGSGAVTIAAGNLVGGRLLLTTGGTASSQAVMTTTGPLFGRPDTNRFYFAARVTAENTSDAQTQLGVGVATVSFASSLLFGSCGGTSTTNWTFQRDGATACSGTVVDTGIALAPGTLFLMEIWTVADGKVHAAINFTEISGSPFTMAAPPTNSLRLYMAAVNGTTASNKGIDIDYWQGCWSQL